MHKNYGIHSNSYQGSYPRILTVCSANMLRSPTAAEVLSQSPYHFNTRSAGTEGYALIKVTPELICWADLVVCMEKRHQKIVEQIWINYDKDALMEREIISLDIADDYEFRDPDLINLIKRKFNQKAPKRYIEGF